MKEQRRTEEVDNRKDEGLRLQWLYNRRRVAQRVIKEIDKLIAEEKNRLQATTSER
ncbi:MAG: hypothetical protein WBP93_18640 [Pyrinomonadaceae bacterium]